MNIIGKALENLKKEHPKKSVRTSLKLFHRAYSKRPSERNRRDRKVLLSFAIAIFDVLLPEEELDRISKAMEPKSRKRLLTIRILILSFIVYQLSPEIKGFNALIQELTTRLNHRLPKDVHSLLAKSSLSYQLSIRNPKIFRAVFFYLLNTIMSDFCSESLKDIPYTVRAIDCSSFDVSPALKKHFGSTKNQFGEQKIQCRMHTVFNVTKRIVEDVTFSDATANEKLPVPDFFASAVSKEPNTIWVCDLGYWAFWIMDTIINRGQHFVFRLRENTTFTIKKVLDAKQKDYLVVLGCPTSRAPYPMRNSVRLVACPQEGSEIYWYVTSLTDPKEFNAAQIRHIYRLRWHIEIFFRDIKHVFEFKPMTQSANGVEIEFYGALISHTLVRTIMYDCAQTHNIDFEDISFQKSSRLINTYIRKKYRIFSDATIEVVLENYLHLLELIAKSCISEAAKKRSAKLQSQQKELRAA